MFTKIKIKNIQGINNEITLDFHASPKKKEKQNTIVKIDNKTSINKVIGILGANASCKTSIIDTLSTIKFFLAKFSFIEKLKKLPSNDSLKNISSFNFLPERNLENLNDISYVLIDLYIPNGEKPGFYTYTLSYDDQYLSEKLSYRKTDKSIKILEIEDYTSEKKHSDIGYKCCYKDSILQDYKNVSNKLEQSFLETMSYYDTFYNYYVQNSIDFSITERAFSTEELATNFISENINLVSKLISIIDPKISKIIIEKDNDNSDIIKFKTIKGAKLEFWNLSTGTKRLLNIFIKIYKSIKLNGIYLCDEIETALHKELIQLIIELYLNNNTYSQLIFTTLSPEVLDKSKLRNDQLFYIYNTTEKVGIKKISDINSRSDYSISKNYYSSKEFSPQPSKESIEDFCNTCIKNM